jgi:[ribosomal protein S18]-alanine N-acetyltransferase
MSIAIRSAGSNDVQAILVIEQQAANAAHWTSEQYEALLAGGVILVAEFVAGETAQICGFICAKLIVGEWEIENVVVAAKFLRRGIASAMLLELIRLAIREEASAILLEVRESNLPARQVYEKHGFRKVGRRTFYYSNPPDDAILYALRFDR